MYEAMTRAYHENNAMRNREKEKVITRKEFEKIVQSMIDNHMNLKRPLITYEEFLNNCKKYEVSWSDLLEKVKDENEKAALRHAIFIIKSNYNIY